ncbi:MULTISPECIES: serine/threonine-protein kinase [Gordonia]|uniref:Serine/threonine-protein kinase PknK n=1 Tax=Gordonia tangerina TaxID=2911060 RepID=A0ABS9DKJ7_9ACTN|nr:MULTISPECIES: serine/threonine-protein kinase [Gordonia]MAU82428.1 protein kinase [Gordonia sp. (in: high G+C Gram-positive bacteria)]MCF3939613.1 protein kinase [Gordonia tangerina]
MAEYDPQTTQRDVVPDIAGQLVGAGFVEPILIGHGGFGAVYRCEQAELDRTVAVKVLTDHLDEENLERFVREQRAMGRLSGHPNIVNILEVGSTPGGHPYIVMQFHPHDSLDSRIRKHGPLAWQDVLRLGIKVSGALETAHRSGTLHRDVKPGNILLTEYGEPQLTDFGIARIAGGFETDADMVTGSPAFTAPELLSGAAPSVATDVYGLGATLFCALTGHAAFERRSGEQVVAQFLRMSAEPLPDLRAAGIPAPLSRAVEWAMARDPDDRPGTVVEYGEGLRDVQRQLGLSVDEMALPIESASDPIGAGPDRRVRAGITTAPPTPSTKFRPPVRPRAQVPRDRLMEILRAGERRRLIVIHAPAGYGKTTVATQWGEELVRDGVAVAWLTVDDDDNDLARFLANIVEALRRAAPVVVGDLAEVIEEHGAKAEQYVLTSLINEIHARHEQLAIVVDDWHRVSDPASIAAMDFLLERGCHHLQVVITSRSRAGLPISRMQVLDELVEIDIAGLCFDAAEAHSFLVDVAGLPLQGAEVTELRNSTDGWVAALQLACLSLRGADTPAELISHISGRHHAIGDFLAENVLSTLEPEVLEFLLTVSPPERLCAGLASALSGQPRGQALLEDIETRDLFLRRVDQEGEWFRFHPLFAEFLRRRLERDMPDAIIRLHGTASEWFAAHGMPAEAVNHALAAGDTDRAVALVEADGRTLIEHAHMATLLGLVDKLPPAAVAKSPRVQLLLTWANVLLHRTTSAEGALSRVAAALAASPDHGDPDIRVEADVLEGCVRVTADRTDGIDELVAEALARPETLPAFVVSAAANVATIAETFRFDFDAAHRRQQQATPYHQQNTGPYAVMYGHALDGIAYFEQLELDRAEECFRSALRVSVDTRSATKSQGARLACAVLADVLYERGRVDESRRLIEESSKLGADEGVIDMIKARFIIGARLAVLDGDRAGAAALLDEGIDIADRLDSPRLRAFVEAEYVIQDLPARRGVHPRVTYDTRTFPDVGIAAIVAQLDAASAIRLLRDSSDAADRDQGLRWAQDWVDHLATTGRERAKLRAARLLATCLAAAGRMDEAKQQAAQVVVRCVDTGMVRYPLDGGVTFLRLVEAIRSDIGKDTWSDSTRRPPVRFLDELLGRVER